MIDRGFWINEINRTWKQAPIVWLTGVRRSGKTTLCQTFADAKYLNCDLRQTAVLVEDPESFYRSVKEPVVVFDEVHQLDDPSRLLKVGADVFPHLRILATGSSTLAATKKFRDTLTGRKRSVILPPVLFQELPAFGIKDLRERLFRGGLPKALLAEQPDQGFYGEWLDSYFARDIQELFHVEKRAGFLRLLEAVLRQSGGLAEVSNFAKTCGLSRPTILNYLEVFQMTHVVHVLRPYHGGGRQEILQQPKIFGFDTGFVRYANGWNELREDDCGTLWEHLVLDTLLTYAPTSRIHFWRNKQKQEVDFIIARGRKAADAIECKWSAAAFDPAALRAFRLLHPAGRNIVVAADLRVALHKKMGGVEVDFIPLEQLPEIVTTPGDRDKIA